MTALRYFLFRWIYLLGLPAALLIAVSSSSFLEQYSFSVPDFSDYLLLISVGHMIVLILIALPPGEWDSHMGAKLQTAGYLHTLIGFTSALFRINPADFTLGSFLIPIGSAVITSILGWYAGGEIEARGRSQADVALKTESERIAGELRTFARVIKQAHVDYASALKEASRALHELQAKQTKILERATEAGEMTTKTVDEVRESVASLSTAVKETTKSVNENLGEDFRGTLSDINASGKSAATQLGGFAAAARDVASYLNQSRALVEAMSDLLENIASRERTTQQ